MSLDELIEELQRLKAANNNDGSIPVLIDSPDQPPLLDLSKARISVVGIALKDYFGELEYFYEFGSPLKGCVFR